MPVVQAILEAALKEGYSAQNIAFGMGTSRHSCHL